MSLLLAKSPKGDQPAKGLIEHSLDVMDAFESLFGTLAAPSRLGECWLQFFGLPAETWPRFFRHGLAAAGLHDPGKANNGFQGAVQGKGEQAIRHEHLSALMLALPPVARWLEQGGLDPLLVAVVAAGHHLKLSQKDQRLMLAQPQVSGVNLLEIQGERQLAQLFQHVAERVGLPPWTDTLPLLWGFSGSAGRPVSIATMRDDITRRMERMKRDLRRDAPKCHLWRALLAALIATDAAGSGLPRADHSITQWLAATFGEPPLTGDDIREKVIAPRIVEIETHKRRTDPGFTFREQDFQTAAANLPERTLLLAGCGAGKTLAAWRWIAARLDQRPAARVIFLYPTRATATEGFRDYVSHAPESDATLLSGTAAYELPDLFQNPDDDRTRRDYETDDRLYAIGFWQKRVFEFLGFLQLSYRSLCLLPLLADSVVVVDEVHSFDHRLWTALKTLLKEFRVPVLCMTASLPAPRRHELVDGCGLTLYPGPGHTFDDLEQSARLRRYQVRAIAGEAAAKALAVEALAQKKRVLWVVNTVDRCQRLARELQALCYHSRFTLDDRKQRHREVVAAFQPGGAPDGVIALTTQVCEMSLDLDADVLISELAPIPSLIQRMGRCNRKAQDESRQGRVYCYAAETSQPYRDDEIAPARAFLAALDGQAVSQQRLEEELEQRTRLDPRSADAWIQFTEGAPWAAAGEEDLRDSHDYTVNAILDRDLNTVLALRKRRDPIDGFIVPVPHRHAQYEARLAPALRLARTDHYHPQFGFLQEPAHACED